MRPSRIRASSVLLLWLALPRALHSQGTNGAIEGSITDEQGRALSGASVTVESRDSGLSRSLLADDAGGFRAPGLPIGAYTVRAEVAGMPPHAAGAVVNVGATTLVTMRIPVALQTEAITITSAPPLIDPRDSGVGEIVTRLQIDSLPLNGRQFANLAALMPGVGLGFLVNIGKATQFAPQVAGGSGRNVNYLVDGGGHNDARRGGLSQLFPLDSIEEFDLHYRYRAEYGPAAGSVLNVVTKTGGRDIAGSVFAHLRDDVLNARTESERRSDRDKSAFRRYQSGGFLGGPLAKDRARFFVSFEAVHQDTSRFVDTRGVFPEQDGEAPLPLREKLLVAKLSGPVGARHYASFRYGFNADETVYPYPERPPDSWTDIENTYHSANLSVSSLVRMGVLNELVAQYSTSANSFRPTSRVPMEVFPGGLSRGSVLDMRIDSRQVEVRDDLTWSRGRHVAKMGAGILAAPVQRNVHAELRPIYYHLSDDRSSPIDRIASWDSLLPAGAESFPSRQYVAYAQDSYRVRNGLTLDLGVRYELATSLDVDQSANPLFEELQAAGRAGQLRGIAGLEDFGRAPRSDRDNVSPRLGFVWDRAAEGTFLVRGGAGRYYDSAFTEFTVGRFGVRGLEVLAYYLTDAAGLRNGAGEYLRAGDPLPPGNEAAPFPGNITAAGAVSPRIEQPFADQANLGLSKTLGRSYVLELDAVYARGHGFGIAPYLNVIVEDGHRRLAGILPAFGEVDWGVAVSRGEARYTGLTFTAKKGWDGRLQFLASYTLSSSRATMPAATDDGYDYRAVDAEDPLGPIQLGPAATDARHRFTASAVWSPGRAITVGAVFRHNSPTPYTVITGRDDNGDGRNFDLPPGSRSVNQARGAGFTQLDLRAAKRFAIHGHTSVELIAEVFNLFDAANPAGYEGNMQSPGFGSPTVFAGDILAGEARQGEQRQARIGVRVRFGAGAGGPP